MYVVLVTDKRLGGTTPYGPYRELAKASEIVKLFRDVNSVDYRDREEYDVAVSKLRKYGD